MVDASQWYSLVSIGSASLALLLSAYVMRRIPNRRAGDTFILAMVFFVLAGVFAYLLRTSVLIEDAPNPGPLALAVPAALGLLGAVTGAVAGAVGGKIFPILMKRPKASEPI